MYHAIALYFYTKLIDAYAKVRFDIGEAVSKLHEKKFENEMLEVKPVGCGLECPICFPGPMPGLAPETQAAFAAANIPVPTPSPRFDILTPEVARDLAKDDLVDQNPV
jgi:hypothetical protein